MLKIAAVALASFSTLTVGVAATSSWVVVDVKTADGPRIILPVPLVAARAALAMAPEEARRVEVPEMAEYSELAARIIDELREAPDGVLVEVKDRDDDVLIEKVGDEIHIDVASDDEDVSVQVPLDAIAEVLESYDGREVDAAQILRALGSISRSDLVHVKTAEEEVKIWVW